MIPVPYILLILGMVGFFVYALLVPENRPLTENDSLGTHALYGEYRVLYPDGKRSQKFSYKLAKDYRDMFGGAIIKAVVLLMLFAGVASAQTLGTFVGHRDQTVSVYHNIPVPPAGYIHGAMRDEVVRGYQLESEGHVYDVVPDNKYRDPLLTYAHGDLVTLRLDAGNGRLYVIAPRGKKQEPTEYRYNIVETNGK